MKRKVFVQAYFHCNLGDDLFIKILCERYPDTDFILVAPKQNMKKIDGVNNLKIVRRNIFFRICNKIQKKVFHKTSEGYIASRCDCTVLLGGSMFMELSQEKWKRILRNYSDICRSSDYFFVIGTNFGPYFSSDFFNKYRKFFERTDSIVFRDKWSYDLFSDLKQVSYAPDVVFNLKIPNLKKEKQIVISPIYIENRAELSGCDKYYSSLAKLCDQAVAEGYSIAMLSFCKEQKDDMACEKIISMTSENVRESIKQIVYEGNIDDFLKIISSSEAVVATRFHSMILGFLMSCKVYPIIYSNKSINVLNDLEFKGKFDDIRKIQSLSIADVLNDNNYINVDEMVYNAEQQFLALDKFLNQR